MPGLFAGTSLERPVTCERCEQPVATCACPRDATGNIRLPKHQSPRVRREQRRGRTVTVVAGLDPVATDLRDLLRRCRDAFAGGAGGTVTNEDTIEIQGDHRDKAVEFLKSLGYAAKGAGG